MSFPFPLFCPSGFGPPVSIYGPTAVAGDNGNTGGYSIRVLTGVISGNYTQVRVSWKGGSSAGIIADHCSIGKHTSNGGTAATPVETLFGGVSGFAGSAGGTNVSDWTNLTVANGDVLVCIIDQNSAANNLSTAAVASCYFSAATASYNSTSAAGFTLAAANIYGLYLVEGR